MLDAVEVDRRIYQSAARIVDMLQLPENADIRERLTNWPEDRGLGHFTDKQFTLNYRAWNYLNQSDTFVGTRAEFDEWKRTEKENLTATCRDSPELTARWLRITESCTDNLLDSGLWFQPQYVARLILNLLP